MNRSNCTNLKQFEGGRVVKQGDSASLFGFELLDEYWKPVELEGENATITLASSKGKAVFQGVVSNSKVTFRISKVLPVESYLVEVSCGGYVFPSDQNVRNSMIPYQQIRISEIFAFRAWYISQMTLGRKLYKTI